MGKAAVGGVWIAPGQCERSAVSKCEPQGLVSVSCFMSTPQPQSWVPASHRSKTSLQELRMKFAFILSRGDITHFLSQVDWEVTYTQYNSCYLVYVFEFGQTTYCCKATTTVKIQDGSIIQKNPFCSYPSLHSQPPGFASCCYSFCLNENEILHHIILLSLASLLSVTELTLSMSQVLVDCSFLVLSN